MTKRQKLQIEQSELRQKINALLGLDELTDEQRAEMEADTKRAQELEPELRAAIVSEGAEEAEARGQFGNNGDGESAEVRQLLGSTLLTDYMGPAGAGAAIEGRAAELNAALGVPISGRSGGVAVPWEAVGRPRLYDDSAERWFRNAAAYTTTAVRPWNHGYARRAHGLRSSRAHGMAASCHRR